MHSGWGSPLPATNRHFLPSDHDARSGPVPVSQEVRPFAESRLPSVGLAQDLVKGLIKTPSGGCLAVTDIDALAPAHSGGLYPRYHPSNPSGIDPDPSKKEYCTHWIRTNSCGFMQQGCKYKHTMPDLAKLKKLGFAETPKWYRDKIAILAGASSWLRPHSNTDNNDQPLSIEPAASRVFRPPVLELRCDQPRAAALSGLAPLKAHRYPVEPPNLIDLDDSSMGTMSLAPSSSIISLPGTISRIVEVSAEKPTEHVNKTLASSLRQERSDVEKITKAPSGTGSAIRSRPLDQQKTDDTVLSVPAMPAKETSDSSAMAEVHSMSSGLSSDARRNGVSNNSCEATNRCQSIAKSSTAMGPEAKCNRQSFELQQTHSPRMRKLGGRPASTGTLASSKHSTRQKLRKGNSPSKGPKRGESQGEAKD